MSLRGRAVHTMLTRFSPGARFKSRLLPSSFSVIVFIRVGLSPQGEQRAQRDHGAQWFPRQLRAHPR